MLSFLEKHLFQIANRFQNQYLPLDLFLSNYFRGHKALGSKDRRFISETLYGIVRWQGLLDALSKGEPSWEKRYALYQKLQPIESFQNSSLPLHIQLSMPAAFFSLVLEQYGEEKAIAIAKATNAGAPVTLRINPLKTTREALLARFQENHECEPTAQSSWGIQFKKRTAFFEMEEFKQGLFEVQDEASQLVAQLVAAKPGDQVLDYCAGSGGKTLAFAANMHHKGQIYLHDVRPLALAQAKKRLKRAGIQNSQILEPEHPYLEKLKKKMDIVLVDAPCSGTGTFRRNPEMKWKFSPEMLNRLLEMQREIFEKALEFMRPGGKIIYATCSLLKQENEEQLAFFMKKHPLKLASSPFISLPTIGGMDGFFAATLTRSP